MYQGNCEFFEKYLYNFISNFSLNQHFCKPQQTIYAKHTLMERDTIWNISIESYMYIIYGFFFINHNIIIYIIHYFVLLLWSKKIKKQMKSDWVNNFIEKVEIIFFFFWNRICEQKIENGKGWKKVNIKFNALSSQLLKQQHHYT